MTPSLLVNGVVVGCWGREASGGNFDVKELIYPLIPSSDTQGEEVSICILSGLNLNGTEVNTGKGAK